MHSILRAELAGVPIVWTALDKACKASYRQRLGALVPVARPNYRHLIFGFFSFLLLLMWGADVSTDFLLLRLHHLNLLSNIRN